MRALCKPSLWMKAETRFPSPKRLRDKLYYSDEVNRGYLCPAMRDKLGYILPEFGRHQIPDTWWRLAYPKPLSLEQAIKDPNYLKKSLVPPGMLNCLTKEAIDGKESQGSIGASPGEQRARL